MRLACCGVATLALIIASLVVIEASTWPATFVDASSHPRGATASKRRLPMPSHCPCASQGFVLVPGSQAPDASAELPHSDSGRRVRGRLYTCLRPVTTLVRGNDSLPHQPEESVIESGDPGDTEYQGDSEECMRTDAIEDANEVKHDSGSCFRCDYVRRAPDPL
jgi:hypothetical protein